MATTICFFNANNLFLRYRFGRTYPGDISGQSYIVDPEWGFLPPYANNSFVPFRPEQTELTAKAISVDGLPEVLCLCEVESLLALRMFNDQFLNGHYDYALLIDSRDYRQIDVGILSNKEIISCRTHVDDLNGHDKPIFSRDCLEVVISLNASGSKRLTLFINHLKSKFVDERNKTGEEIEAARQAANEKRNIQAGKVKEIVQTRFPADSFRDELFMVIGDFNDHPQSPWIRPLMNEAGLYDVIKELGEEERWTYWWKRMNRASQIDYLLLSPALVELVRTHNIKPRIERMGIGIKGFYASGKINPRTTRLFETEDDPDPVRINFEFDRFPEVLETRQHASDHCPVFLEVPVS